MDPSLPLKVRIDIAAGRHPADLVLRNGKIVNVLSCEVHDGDVAIAGDRIVGIGRYEAREVVDLRGQYICPGFIDGHVHIESSMLNVPQYARLVCSRGTSAVVTDPHEIANVFGAEGIRYMLAAAKYAPLYVYAMLSSCVPASKFETAGAELEALDIEPLLADRWVLGLAEMMNYPGIVAGDPSCLDKITLVGARPVDGHCPGLSGRDLCAYIASGIGSDHECTTADEAREKLRLGLHIMIREGSQARDLNALLPLISAETLERFSFVTDDKDVDDLLAEGHIDHIVRRAVAAGLNPIHAVKIATSNTAHYFGLHSLGAVAPGRLACLAIVEDLRNFRVTRTYHAGRLVAQDGVCIDAASTNRPTPVLRASMNMHALRREDFAVPPGASSGGGNRCNVHVLEVLEGRIDTKRSIASLPVENGAVGADAARDILKIAVVERHRATGNVGIGFVTGFGFQRGAIASSVGHDSHNVVVVGANDADMLVAARRLADIGGGFCVVDAGRVIADCPLPIAGLMSNAEPEVLSAQLRTVHEAAAALGGKLRRPFMALSFLSLSVIGKLKVTDQGLIDVDKFERISVLA